MGLLRHYPNTTLLTSGLYTSGGQTMTTTSTEPSRTVDLVMDPEGNQIASMDGESLHKNMSLSFYNKNDFDNCSKTVCFSSSSTIY